MSSDACKATDVVCNSDYGISLSRGKFTLKSGVWQKISLFVQLNSPSNVAVRPFPRLHPTFPSWADPPCSPRPPKERPRPPLLERHPRSLTHQPPTSLLGFDRLRFRPLVLDLFRRIRRHLGLALEPVKLLPQLSDPGWSGGQRWTGEHGVLVQFVIGIDVKERGGPD